MLAPVHERSKIVAPCLLSNRSDFKANSVANRKPMQIREKRCDVAEPRFLCDHLNKSVLDMLKASQIWRTKNSTVYCGGDIGGNISCANVCYCRVIMPSKSWRGALADIRLKRTISGTAQSWDCGLRLNDANDEDDVTCDGRLFHAWAAATGNARPPSVFRWKRGTTRLASEADRSPTHSWIRRRGTYWFS